MTTTTRPPPKPDAEKTLALALRLAHAEHALLAFTTGQIDAIVDPDGQAYLLRPAQEHLLQNERRLQAVIDSAADVITVVDRSGIILSQSPAAGRVLGYEPEELVGSSIFALIHEADVEPLYSAFFNVIEGFHENATAQFRHPARDGSYRLVEATVGKLRDVSPASVVISMRPVASPQRWRTERSVPVARDVLPAGQDRELALLSHQRQTPRLEVLPSTSSNQSTSAAGRTP